MKLLTITEAKRRLPMEVEFLHRSGVWLICDERTQFYYSENGHVFKYREKGIEKLEGTKAKVSLRSARELHARFYQGEENSVLVVQKLYQAHNYKLSVSGGFGFGPERDLGEDQVSYEEVLK